MENADLERCKRINWESYLLEVSREESAALEAELQRLRGSARYKAGEWLLDAWPPRLATFRAIFRLMRFFVWRRSTASRSAIEASQLKVPEAAFEAPTLVFGHSLPQARYFDQVWKCDSADQVARRLDNGSLVGTLILRIPHQQLLRRVDRLQRDGWVVIWDPEPEADEADPALVAYAQEHNSAAADFERT